MSAKGASSKRTVWTRRGFLWLVFAGLVGYRALALESRGAIDYVLYLPETVLLAFMVILAGLSRPRRKGWLCSLLLLMPVLWVGLTPVGSDPQSAERLGLRLVSANLDSWNTDMAQAAKKLAEQKPDLLCLQEVWTEKHLEALRQAFPDFEFVPSSKETKGHFDIAVFLGVRRDCLIRPLEGSPGVAGAVVRQRGREVLLMSVHGLKESAYWPESVRVTMQRQAEQATEILRVEQAEGLPSLVGGDFNAPITGPGLKLLRSRFQVASRQSTGGPVLTYPASLPLLEIDHVLATSNLVARDYRVFSTGSDHLAVMADF